MSIGLIEAIHIAERAGAPVQAVPEVEALAGVGLDGDRYADGTGNYSPDTRVDRGITLIEAEEIERLATESGIELAPGESRRNVTTRGIRLNELVGRRFTVGEALCEGLELCEPCAYLEGLVGKPILRPLVHRAGLRGRIVSSGPIRVGDAVTAAGMDAEAEERLSA